MQLTPLARRRARYLVPVGAAAVAAVVVVAPQAASGGAQHPDLPAKTAAQLLASLEQTKLPQFSGTTVETAQLGLPSIGDNELPAGISPSGQSQLMQIVTLLTGSHTTQIAYGGPAKQRVAIFLSDLSETDVVHNGDDVWTYSSDNNTVTHNTLNHGIESSHSPDMTAPVNPAKAAEQALARIDPSTKVTVDRTAQVAGRPAYQLDLSPRDSRTLIGSVHVALDAATSMPLRVQIWSRQDSTSPAFSVGFTSISMSAPSASTFEFSKPPSATVAPAPLSGEALDRFPPRADRHTGKAGSHAALGPAVKTIGHGWTSVFVAKLHDVTPPQGAIHTPANGASGPGLAQELDQLGTRVAAGHVITTSLLTILVTNDNRILIGAVTPRTIEQAAASKAAE